MEERSRRYWVSWSEPDPLAREEDQLNYKTYDLEDAIREAKLHQAEIMESYPHLKADETGVRIVAQPECPKCGELGRFADTYCSSCGTKLLPKEDIDFESLSEKEYDDYKWQKSPWAMTAELNQEGEEKLEACIEDETVSIDG